jgi:protein TonB
MGVAVTGPAGVYPRAAAVQPERPAPATPQAPAAAVAASPPDSAPHPPPPPAAASEIASGPETAAQEAGSAAERPPTAPAPPARPAAPLRPQTLRAAARDPSAPGEAPGAAGGAAGRGESPGAGTEAGGAPGAGGTAGDPGLRQRYAAQLRGWVARHQHYPRSARDQRQEGRGAVRFRIDRAGRIVAASVETGTGHAVLDAELLAMLRRAEPMPAMPAALPGEGFEVVLPVTFAVR